MIAIKNKILIVIVLILIIFPGYSLSGEYNFNEERRSMVSEQLVERGIKDKRVLKAMSKVPRHKFVKTDIRTFSYFDSPLPIGNGQTISQPYIVALMSELLALKGDEKVLEIGTGSGYQAAVLAELAHKVYTIEIIKSLADSSRELLKKLGYTNVEVLWADGYKGWPEYAPFDAIIVTCAPNDIPRPLAEQLAEGGRMVIPVGDDKGIQKLLLLQKTNGKLEKKYITDVRFVPMTNEVR